MGRMCFQNARAGMEDSIARQGRKKSASVAHGGKALKNKGC
jgi:hypothetical protein